ncbi:MAG TPA: helix-turn-helix domain-containing protein [Alphaproteobacteria bacterium]|nr:helix-turn-helix domain-containing protein [Alphaproteobacteria bacterium]
MMMRPLVSSAQCRAARALLGWTQATLADRAGVARKTVAHFEVGRRALLARTRRDITETFERAGLEFIWSPSSGDGVRFAPRPPALPLGRDGLIETR